MSKVLTLRINWIALFAMFIFLLLLSSFLILGKVHAQTPEEIAQQLGVTFPITELGDCNSYYECRSFCEDPLNYDTCFNYGRDRGLYEDVGDPRDQKVLDVAKGELGCDSYATCKSFCEVPANHDKCNSFARSQNLAGGHVDDPNKAEILGKAKEVLGCDSYISCASFCSDDVNKSKCSDFAKQTGLSGGERPVGPGGCSSEQTCKSFCSDPNNYSVCSGFTQAAGGNFSGPGGCNSPDSCRTYCEKNPSDCGYVAGAGASPRPYYNSQEMCNRTPRCAWTSNSCQCGSLQTTEDEAKKASEYAKYCRENPDKCTPGGVGSFDTREDRAAFEEYCTQNPDKCRPAYHGSSDTFTPFQEGTSVGFDPARQCGLYAGCSWVDGACRCGTQYYSYPTPGVSCPEGQYIGPGGYCIPSGGTYTYPTPFTYTYPTPGSTYTYPTPYSYYTTPGSTYTYPTPYSYAYPSPYSGIIYYSYPTPGVPYSYPSPYSSGTYVYPTPYPGYSYPTPYSGYSYPTPGGTYSYPTPGSGYTYPTPYSYTYPTPYSYSYPTPGSGYTYPTPYSYSYPTPGTYSYPTPSSYSYPTPAAYSYPTPQAYSYPTPEAYSYPTPQAYSYPTPEAYSYPTPQSYSYPTPSGVQGVTTGPSLLEQFIKWLGL